MSRNNIAESILDAVEHWKKTALLSDGGVFGKERIWSVDCLEELGSVAEQLDNKNFYENLGTQLKQKPPEIIQLAAEICWFVYLCPSMSQSNKREKIESIWKESGRPFPESSELLSDETLRGIGHGGTAFFVWPRSEFMFFIRLIASLKNLPVFELEKLLSDPWEFAEWIEQENIPEHETRTLRHMTLLLLFPDNFERVFSGTQKREIVHKFTGETKAQVRSLSPTSIDRHILDIRHQEEKKYPDVELDFYGSPLKEKWSNEAEFTWTKFYEAVAKKLLDFKDRRDELVKGIHEIVARVDSLSGFQDKFKDGTTGPLKDICPFTTMGIFNQGHTFENRKIIAKELANFLGVSELPPNSFDGVPVVSTRNSWFFSYKKDRKDDDIDTLWEVFDQAIRLAESDHPEERSDFIKAYDNALQCRGVAWNLTMGLYWVSPFNFPALDGLSRNYISKKFSINIPKKVCNANEYLEILDTLKAKFEDEKFPIHSFPELSLAAWLYNKTVPEDDPSNDRDFRKNETNENNRKAENTVNLILYGPPGTGKTYQLNKLTEKYSGGEQSLTKQAWLIQELYEAPWFDVVFGALYDLGRKAKVNSISEHEYVRIKAQSIGRDKNIKNTIWSVLQSHTPEDSETVRFNNRGKTPTAFDKDKDSVWFLVGDWEEECQEQIELAGIWKDGPKPELSQERFEFVTFHQAYSYEDFVEGIRPRSDEDGVKYEVVPGVFKRICQRAKVDPGQRYAIFIDEINRGNIASIFGELITLLETDKRVVYGDDGSMKSGMTLTLPYSGEKFGVPNNLDVYGTMNTADRSIALLDTALRRRFQFKELMPDTSVINGSLGNGLIEDGEGGTIDLRKLLEAVNRRIRFLLGRDMTIGHSYLINVRDFDDLKNVLYSRIIPLLQEYFYDDWHRIQLVFRDVGATGEKLESQIIRHAEMKEEEIIGFDHDDFEDSVEYSVTPEDEITPASIRKIYEESN